MSEITSAIVWNDQLLNHHPEMDATHREFVDHLAQVQAALDGPQDALLARYDAMLAHTVEHFAQEDRWMKDLGFTDSNCHSAQHGQVLAVMREVRRQHAEGQSDLIGRLLPELMTWFENHAQAADAGLAGSMEDVGYDVRSGVMTNPPRGGPPAEDGEPVTEHGGCGSSSC
ncbi:MAG: hypothetical protein RL654_3685 [Pseudomonadota bacterium]|jgi:hemerythrin-like metal-binding protein